MRKTVSSLGPIAAIAFLLCASIASAQDTAAPAQPSSMPFTLLQIQADVQESLDKMASEVENATLSLSASGLTGSEAQEVLARVLGSSPQMVEAVTFSRDGRILAAECKGAWAPSEPTSAARSTLPTSLNTGLRR